MSSTANTPPMPAEPPPSACRATLPPIEPPLAELLPAAPPPPDSPLLPPLAGLDPWRPPLPEVPCGLSGLEQLSDQTAASRPKISPVGQCFIAQPLREHRRPSGS